MFPLHDEFHSYISQPLPHISRAFLQLQDVVPNIRAIKINPLTTNIPSI